MAHWRRALILLAPPLWLASCVAEPEEIGEPGRGDQVLREGVYREPQSFTTPPPLKPKAIDGTPKSTKPAWKKPPVSVLGVSPTARAGVSDADAGNREVQDALDASQIADRRHEAERAAARRAEREGHAKGTRRELEALAREARERREAASQERAKGEAAAVQAVIDGLRREHGQRSLGALEEAAHRRQAALRREAERRSAEAERARENAERARRFAEASTREGVIVPAALTDAKRAQRAAAARELEADLAEAQAHWAALALRRILRGQVDPPSGD